MPAQVYLEISIGDQAAADRSWATYQLSKSYYEKVGGQVCLACVSVMSNPTFQQVAEHMVVQLGLAETSFDALEEEHIELLSESFAADPSWNTKASCSVRCCPRIRKEGPPADGV